jgi:hypothetical protein
LLNIHARFCHAANSSNTDHSYFTL